MSPKQSEILKDKRLNALRAILRQYGTIDKSALTKAVAKHFGVQASIIARNLYRDLNDLKESREVEAVYTTLAGSKLEVDGDDRIVDDRGVVYRNVSDEKFQISKPFKTLWRWVGSQDEILGGSLLSNFGGRFICSARLKDAFKLDLLLSKPSGDSIHLICSIGKTFLDLSITKNDLPFTILLGRVISPDTFDPIKILEQSFGKRTCALMLPVEVLTAVRSQSSLGHLVLTFTGPEAQEVKLKALDSKNITRYSPIAQESLSVLNPIFDNQGNVTRSRPSEVVVAEKLKKGLRVLSKGKETICSRPLYIEVADGFRMLVI